MNYDEWKKTFDADDDHHKTFSRGTRLGKVDERTD